MKDFLDKIQLKLKEINELVYNAYVYDYNRVEMKKLNRRIDNLENKIYQGGDGDFKEYKENSGLMESNPEPKPIFDIPGIPNFNKVLKPRKKYFTKKMRERMHFVNNIPNDLKNNQNFDSNNSLPKKFDKFEKFNEKNQIFEENKTDANNFENYNSSDNYDDQVELNFDDRDDRDDISKNLEGNENKSMDDKFFENQQIEGGEQLGQDEEAFLKQEEFKNYKDGEKNSMLKRKRKVCRYPLTYKLKAIYMNDDIKDHTLTAKYLGIPRSTLWDWISMREKIEMVCNSENGNKCSMSHKVKRNREIYMEQF